jgi:hypothetical protein
MAIFNFCTMVSSNGAWWTSPHVMWDRPRTVRSPPFWLRSHFRSVFILYGLGSGKAQICEYRSRVSSESG